MKLAIRPLTPDLWPAFEDLFVENGAVRLVVSTPSHAKLEKTGWPMTSFC